MSQEFVQKCLELPIFVFQLYAHTDRIVYIKPDNVVYISITKCNNLSLVKRFRKFGKYTFHFNEVKYVDNEIPPRISTLAYFLFILLINNNNNKFI